MLEIDHPEWLDGWMGYSYNIFIDWKRVEIKNNEK